MILCGNYNLKMENNIVLFRAVHRYIHATKRFKTSWLFVWIFSWKIFFIIISILMANLFYSQDEGFQAVILFFNYPISIIYLFIYLLFWCSIFPSFIHFIYFIFIYYLSIYLLIILIIFLFLCLFIYLFILWFWHSLVYVTYYNLLSYHMRL